MYYYIIVIFIVIILLLYILKKKQNKENFTDSQHESNQWWDSIKKCDDSKSKTTKETIEDIMDTCQKKTNHYIETADDNFSDYGSIKLNYNNKKNEAIIQKFGTNNLAENEIPKNHEEEMSVKDLLNKTIEGNDKTINQGKEILNFDIVGKEKGNPKGTNNNTFENINTLEDYYKHQIIKKKNYVSYKKGDNISKKSIMDDRFVDISDGKYYDGEKYVYLPGHTEDKEGVPENYVIDNIGYSDLFSRPHVYQGSTDNLVSRSFHSDEGTCSSTIQNGRCIPGKSCCEGGKECYPAVKKKSDTPGEDKDAIVYPKMVAAACKPCPIGLQNTYSFPRPGGKKNYFSNIGGFYTNDGGKPNDEEVKSDLSNMLSDVKGKHIDGYKHCKACSFHAGCRYDELGRARDTHFEAQSCINGNDRICKACRVCKMGTEYVETGCGEGGIKNDTKCAKCSKCKEGTFKVAGCATYNSFFDTHCIKMSDCKGKPKTDDENSPDYYEDPGEGKRFYMTGEGYSGGHKFGGKSKLYSNSPSDSSGMNGEELPNPYFGKDRSCRKCDICPEGTNMIGDGCTGINSTKNSICQRLIPVDKYVNKLRTCDKGKFYDRQLLRQKLTYDFEASKQSGMVDKRVIDFYINDKEIRDGLEESQKNDIKFYKDNPMPEFSDEDIIEMACTDCKKCEEGTYTNPKNSGCVGDNDTICIPKTECKPYEIIENEGDNVTDRKCAPCKCPQDQWGIAKCKGNKIISGCEDRTKCKKGEYKFDDPVQYSDVTKDTICKKCKKCPPNSFKLADCNNSTDTVCKNHGVCGDKQYVVKKGTDISDTICKCIDGFELPQDEFGTPNLEASNCIPSKGKCWSNPCHPNAKCYDRFDDKGNFIEYVCRCNNQEGYIESGKKGVGPQGCRRIPTKHSHDLMGLAPAIDYGLSDNINKIMTHMDGDYHRKLEAKHLHKN